MRTIAGSKSVAVMASSGFDLTQPGRDITTARAYFENVVAQPIDREAAEHGLPRASPPQRGLAEGAFDP